MKMAWFRFVIVCPATITRPCAWLWCGPRSDVRWDGSVGSAITPLYTSTHPARPSPPLPTHPTHQNQNPPKPTHLIRHEPLRHRVHRVEKRQLQDARRPGAQHARGRALARALLAPPHREGLHLLPAAAAAVGGGGRGGEGRVADDGRVAHGCAVLWWSAGWLGGACLLVVGSCSCSCLAGTNVEGRRCLLDRLGWVERKMSRVAFTATPGRRSRVARRMAAWGGGGCGWLHTAVPWPGGGGFLLSPSSSGRRPGLNSRAKQARRAFARRISGQQAAAAARGLRLSVGWTD